MRYRNGNVYEGEWKAGMKEGRGVFRFAAAGDVYDGEWAAGAIEGYTELRLKRYASGNVYTL